MPSAPYFPLRWESTGDQWWFASPIDWAAANGHYELVGELLHVDGDLLIKLTSLRRIRRLETVWDDDSRFVHAARCRSYVARRLFLDCEGKSGSNTLIRAGYGGWLLYTCASAGDLSFVRELLGRDPLLVFGEGEYGVTDMFYAAARGGNSEVFRLFLDYATRPRRLRCASRPIEREICVNNSTLLKSELLNRAVHAAARGGNLMMLKELIWGCSDILAFRDAWGSTVLHAAAARGQEEVVKDLVTSFDIVHSRDDQGNTALHVAAFKGHLSVVERLILLSSSSIYLRNNVGDTFLHMAVSGFSTHGFRRLDRQMELMRCLAFGDVINIEEIVNARNNEGQTILHMAVTGKVHPNLVELLINIKQIDLNVQDANGMTALDLLSQCSRSATSEILARQLISAGAIIKSKENCAQGSTVVSHTNIQNLERSPGSSFKVSDADIFFYTGIEGSDTALDSGSERSDSPSSTCISAELMHLDKDMQPNLHGSKGRKKYNSPNSATRHLKSLLIWNSRKKNKIQAHHNKLDDDCSVYSYDRCSNRRDIPTSLRQRFSSSRLSSILNNRRMFAICSPVLSPSSTRNFVSGLIDSGANQAIHMFCSSRTHSSSFSRSSISSPQPDKQKSTYYEWRSGFPSYSESPVQLDSPLTYGATSRSASSLNSGLMTKYFCFGAQGLTVEDPIKVQRSSWFYKRSPLSAA